MKRTIMKRTLAFLVAVASFWTVSFVQAANVGLNFYSGVPCEKVSYAEDLHYAVVDVDGNSLVSGDLTAENRGHVDTVYSASNFYVIAEQGSTKYFGSVLIDKEVVDGDEFFFIVDESGLIWLKDAHKCIHDEENAEELSENEERCAGSRRYNGKCCDDDCCDEDCICRRLEAYRHCAAPDAAEAETEGMANTGTESAQGNAAPKNGQSTQAANQARSVAQPRSPSRNTVNPNSTSNPYTSGMSNLGGVSPMGAGVGAGVGAAGGMSGLAMLGVVGAMIATTVAVTSKDPVSGK